MRDRISCHLRVGSVLEELALVLVVELLEHVGFELAVVVPNGLDDLLALPAGRCLHEVRDLRGMELGQLRMGDPQPHGGDVAHEGLDLAQSRNSPVPIVAQGPRQQPADAASRPGVDADDAPVSPPPRELDLVGSHQPRAFDVDQLTVEHVPLQQHLVGPALEVAQV